MKLNYRKREKRKDNFIIALLFSTKDLKKKEDKRQLYAPLSTEQNIFTIERENKSISRSSRVQ
jgi:hypothetical protein